MSQKKMESRSRNVESSPQTVATEVTVTAEQPSPLTLPQAISSSLLALHGGEEDEPRLATTSCNSSPGNDVCSLPSTTPLPSLEAGYDITAIAVQNVNNSNSCQYSMHAPTPAPPMPTQASNPPPAIEPPRKKSKTSGGGSKYGNVEVTLEGKTLWEDFYHRGTEMIVNRAGRRMFPGFAVAISGLRPKVKYTMRVEVILADNHRFKFLNARWLAVGTAEPQPLSESYTHPDSPNSGAFWMRHGVSFRKLKITNNKERPGSNVLLHSMHKYYLRLIVDEERKAPPGEEKQPPRNVLSLDFHETTFIAVTAYQNEEVTQLKITNNPFAKAFRENAADMDWETAQMLYGNQMVFSPLPHPHQGDGFGSGNHVNPWPLPSPLLPPTPLTASFPLSPLPGLPPHRYNPHHPYISPAHFRYDSPTSAQFFQWSPVPPERPGSQETFQYPQHKDHPAFPPPPTSSNLPDFDSVFTPQLGPTSS